MARRKTLIVVRATKTLIVHKKFVKKRRARPPMADEKERWRRYGRRTKSTTESGFADPRSQPVKCCGHGDRDDQAPATRTCPPSVFGRQRQPYVQRHAVPESRCPQRPRANYTLAIGLRRCDRRIGGTVRGSDTGQLAHSEFFFLSTLGDTMYGWNFYRFYCP